MLLDDFPNLLPFQGEVRYAGKIWNEKESADWIRVLLDSIPWKSDEVKIFGKRIITRRKVAWYGDPNLQYTYSGIPKKALFWTPELKILKNHIEKITGDTFNSCLLNLYHDGKDGMGWHSDDEPELKDNGTIASLSFGADRRFLFRHKSTREIVEILLQNGSLLVMKGETQKFWKHQLPQATRLKTPRINLTFRTIEPESKAKSK